MKFFIFMWQALSFAVAYEPQANSTCDSYGACGASVSKSLLQRSFQERDTRSLLSRREMKSVPCWDTITDAIKCGQDTITNGDVCGWSVITSAEKCGTSTARMCDQRRRRRGVNKVTCKWDVFAKSCNEPKSCTVAKSCDLADSWSNCLADVTKVVSGPYSDYAKCIGKSGCSSIDDCAKTVKSGMDCAWDIIADTVQSGVATIVDDVIDELPFDARGIVASATTEAETAFSSVDLSAVSTAVSTYLGGTFGSFSKYDIDPCPPSGVNFWYMAPTDCGTFGHLGDVLSNVNNAQSSFEKCEDSLEECVKMTGALCFPTPFLEFKVSDWCLPDYIEMPLEYILGAFMYAYDTGASIVSDIRRLFTKLEDFVKNNLGMSVLQLGRDIKSNQMALLQSNASASQMKADTWSLTTGICFDYPLPLMTVSACVHLIWGEIDGNFVNPNLAFELVLTRSIFGAQSFVASEPEPGFSLAFNFAHYYPGFAPASAPRVGAAAGMQLALDFEIQGLAEVGVPFAVFFLPDPCAALGFGLGISVARDAATDLVQKTMLTQAQEAEKQMHAKGQGHLASTAGLMTALQHLGNNFDTVLGKVEMHKAPALMKKVAEKPLHEHVPTASLGQDSETSSSVPVKINGKVQAVFGAAICLTFPNCEGQ